MSAQRATITVSGIPGRQEPYARLEDGRTMPMGWNMGKTFAVGQTGTAEYIRTGSVSLWSFTPDEEAAGLPVCAHGAKCDEIGGRCTYADCPYYEGDGEDDSDGPREPDCPACEGGYGVPLGRLGRKDWFRCRLCGIDFCVEDEVAGGEANPSVRGGRTVATEANVPDREA